TQHRVASGHVGLCDLLQRCPRLRRHFNIRGEGQQAIEGGVECGLGDEPRPFDWRHIELASALASIGRRHLGLRQPVLQAMLGLSHAGKEVEIGSKLMLCGKLPKARGTIDEYGLRVRQNCKERSCDVSDRNRVVQRCTGGLVIHALASRTLRATWGMRHRTHHWIRYRPFLVFYYQIAEPFPMVPPGPAASHLAASHGADRPSYPDRRVNVYDPYTDSSHGSECVNENSDTLLRHGKIWTEILIPDHDSARDQHDDQGRHRPEHQLLAGVVLADLGQV